MDRGSEDNAEGSRRPERSNRRVEAIISLVARCSLLVRVAAGYLTDACVQKMTTWTPERTRR